MPDEEDKQKLIELKSRLESVFQIAEAEDDTVFLANRLIEYTMLFRDKRIGQIKNQ